MLIRIYYISIIREAKTLTTDRLMVVWIWLPLFYCVSILSHHHINETYHVLKRSYDKISITLIIYLRCYADLFIVTERKVDHSKVQDSKISVDHKVTPFWVNQCLAIDVYKEKFINLNLLCRKIQMKSMEKFLRYNHF